MLNNTQTALDKFSKGVVKQSRTRLTKGKKNVTKNLYNKLNRGLLFEQLVQEIEPINLTPFTDRLDKGFAGMETTLTISVKNNMTLC